MTSLSKFTLAMRFSFSKTKTKAPSPKTIFKSETFQTRASIATRMRVKEWLPRPPQFQRLARNRDDAEARVLQPASLVRELKPALAGLCSALHHRWSEL